MISDFMNYIVIAMCVFCLCNKRIHTGIWTTLALGCFTVASLADLDVLVTEERVKYIYMAGAMFIILSLILRHYGIQSVLPRASQMDKFNDEPHHNT